MIQLKKFPMVLVTAFIMIGTASAHAQTNDLQFLKTLESCQQTQYDTLLKTHSDISELAQNSSKAAETAKKLRDKLRAQKKYSKAKIEMAKEIKQRTLQGALLGLDSSVLALINEVLTDKTKAGKYKKKLLSKRDYKDQIQLDEIVSAVEQVDINYHEINEKSYLLKLKDERNFRSCVTTQPQLQASVN